MLGSTRVASVLSGGERYERGVSDDAGAAGRIMAAADASPTVAMDGGGGRLKLPPPKMAKSGVLGLPALVRSAPAETPPGVPWGPGGCSKP